MVSKNYEVCVDRDVPMGLEVGKKYTLQEHCDFIDKRFHKGDKVEFTGYRAIHRPGGRKQDLMLLASFKFDGEKQFRILNKYSIRKRRRIK